VDAVRAAGDILLEAASPAVAGLSGLTVEAIREAVLLAEVLHAVIVPHPAAPPGALRAGIDAPESSATLGEVRGTADLVVFWRADPERTHPRHLARYSLDPPLLDGRKRKAVLVETLGSEENLTARRAVEVLVFDPGARGDLSRDIEIIRALRCLMEKEEDFEVEESARLVVDALHRLIGEARHAHFILGEDAAQSPVLSNELARLCARARSRLRITVSALPPSGNGRGVLEVLSWQTGRPGASVFRAASPPRDLAGAIDLERLLELRGADVILAAGLNRALLSLEARAAFEPTQRIVIGAEADPRASVSIRVPGLDPRLPATIVRADGIHLTINGRPSTAASPGDPAALDPAAGILAALTSRISTASP
jgi:formylmethanofuran dehydrogenase subunit B